MTSGTFSRADRDYIVEQLRTRVLEVDFTKADGSQRTMKCTLRGDLLPPAPKPVIDTLKQPKAENLDVIAAYDLESKGWRSFRLDSIDSITIHTHGGSAVTVDGAL